MASTLALAACGKATESGNTDATTSATSTATTTAETTETTMATTEEDGEISADYNDADIMFAQMMIPHHQQAVEMSEMLLAKEGIPAQVVEFAQGVIVNCGASPSTCPCRWNRTRSRERPPSRRRARDGIEQQRPPTRAARPQRPRRRSRASMSPRPTRQ